MARISIPVQPGNRAIDDGTLPAVIARTAERWQPEAIYVTASDEYRTCYAGFGPPGTPDMDRFAEPSFTELDADVDFAPVTDISALRKGLTEPDLSRA